MNKVLSQNILLLFILCSVTLFGCARHSQVSDEAVAREQKTAQTSATIGQRNEQQGIMTSGDYLHWEQLGNKVGMEKRMDDADLDWAISMMKKPSARPAEVHTMMMGFFLTMHTFTPLQKQKIRDAVAPLLSSNDIDDVKWAKAVLKKVS